MAVCVWKILNQYTQCLKFKFEFVHPPRAEGKNMCVPGNQIKTKIYTKY